jgi:hypothetical protein
MMVLVRFYVKKGREKSRPFLLQGTDTDSIEVRGCYGLFLIECILVVLRFFLVCPRWLFAKEWSC